MTSKISVLLVSALAFGAVVAPRASVQAAVPSCGASAIKVSATETEGATGHGSLVLMFRNISSRRCTMFGYPAVDALDQHGHVVARATRSVNGFAGGSQHGVRAVVLNPGASASATVEWLNFNAATSGSCAFSQSIETAPAGTTRMVRLNRSVSTCELQVHPTVPGTSGNG